MEEKEGKEKEGLPPNEIIVVSSLYFLPSVGGFQNAGGTPI
ncbi:MULTISPECIES: hypothetical protein [Bacillus]|nr:MULTISPECIES: hypothetical protein [Bacillus]MDH4423517.1 hypothetical protein [Bacillus cereus]